MVTVVDPGGTPVPVYNLSGKTVLSLSGSGTTSSGGNSGTSIPHFSGTTVVVGLAHNPGMCFTLPAADIGDEVAFALDPSSTFGAVVFPQVGEAIGNFAASTGTNPSAGFGVQINLGIVFTKVSSTSWQPF